MDAVEAANSGHPGMPMGMADAATALFTRHLKFDASDPHWPDRDRFILSAGHGSMLIYALLYLTGYARPTIEDIEHFRQLHSPTAGHPENFELPGVEVTTGPLGQGVAMAVGTECSASIRLPSPTRSAGPSTREVSSSLARYSADWHAPNSSAKKLARSNRSMAEQRATARASNRARPGRRPQFCTAKRRNRYEE